MSSSGNSRAQLLQPGTHRLMTQGFPERSEGRNRAPDSVRPRTPWGFRPLGLAYCIAAGGEKHGEQEQHAWLHDGVWQRRIGFASRAALAAPRRPTGRLATVRRLPSALDACPPCAAAPRSFLGGAGSRGSRWCCFMSLGAGAQVLNVGFGLWFTELFIFLRCPGASAALLGRPALGRFVGLAAPRPRSSGLRLRAGDRELLRVRGPAAVPLAVAWLPSRLREL